MTGRSRRPPGAGSRCSTGRCGWTPRWRWPDERSLRANYRGMPAPSLRGGGMTTLISVPPTSPDEAEPLPKPRRLGPRDILRLGGHGMRTRPLRAVLSAMGIAIGIAAMITVVSIPASSAKALQDEIAALGPNLLTAQPGQTFFGDAAELPESAVPMVRRIAPVTSAAAI